MPNLAWVADEAGSQPTFPLHLQRRSDELWGIAWSYNGVMARRLIIAAISADSPAGKLRNLHRGDELLSVSGTDRFEDMRRLLNEALEVKLLFRSAAESPPPVPPCRSIAPPIATGVTAPTAGRRRASAEPPSIKARVKNTFLHFSDSGEAEYTSGDADSSEMRLAMSDPMPIARLQGHFKSPYKQGCLAGLDLQHARMGLEPSGPPDWASARSSSSVDGTNSAERLSNGIPSCPETDWEFPLVAPPLGMQYMNAVGQAGMAMWLPIGVGPLNGDHIITQQAMLPFVDSYPTGMDSSSSDDVDINPTGTIGGRCSDVTSARPVVHVVPSEASSNSDLSPPISDPSDGDRPLSRPRSNPSDISEAKSEAGPLPKSMAKIWDDVNGWAKKNDDPQSSMDESTAYCPTTFYQKRSRRGGKRVNRPCHVKAKQEKADAAALRKPLSEQDLQQAHLNSVATTMLTAMVLNDEIRSPEVATPPLATPAVSEATPRMPPTEVASKISTDAPVSTATSPAVAEICFPRKVENFLAVQADAPTKFLANAPWRRTSAPWHEVMDTTALDASSALPNDATGERTASGKVSSAVEDGSSFDLVGKRVLVQGLVRMPEFNGQWGTVTAYDESLQRYKVSLQIASGAPLVAKLKRENLFIPDATPVMDLAGIMSAFVANVSADEAPTPTASCKEAATATPPASEATLRRAALRRASRQRVAEKVQKYPATSSARQVRRQPSCPATATRQQPADNMDGSKGLPRRQPSCPATSMRQVGSSEGSGENGHQQNRASSRGSLESSARQARRPSNSMRQLDSSAGCVESPAHQVRRQPSCPAASGDTSPSTSALLPTAKAVAKVTPRVPKLKVPSDSVMYTDSQVPPKITTPSCADSFEVSPTSFTGNIAAKDILASKGVGATALASASAKVAKTGGRVRADLTGAPSSSTSNLAAKKSSRLDSTIADANPPANPASTPTRKPAASRNNVSRVSVSPSPTKSGTRVLAAQELGSTATPRVLDGCNEADDGAVTKKWQRHRAAPTAPAPNQQAAQPNPIPDPVAEDTPPDAGSRARTMSSKGRRIAREPEKVGTETLQVLPVSSAKRTQIENVCVPEVGSRVRAVSSKGVRKTREVQKASTANQRVVLATASSTPPSLSEGAPTPELPRGRALCSKGHQTAREAQKVPAPHQQVASHSVKEGTFIAEAGRARAVSSNGHRITCDSQTLSAPNQQMPLTNSTSHMVTEGSARASSQGRRIARETRTVGTPPNSQCAPAIHSSLSLTEDTSTQESKEGSAAAKWRPTLRLR